jgi:hypothetical protein
VDIALDHPSSHSYVASCSSIALPLRPAAASFQTSPRSLRPFPSLIRPGLGLMILGSEGRPAACTWNSTQQFSV